MSKDLVEKKEIKTAAKEDECVGRSLCRVHPGQTFFFSFTTVTQVYKN